MDIDKKNFSREYCESRMKHPLMAKFFLYSGAVSYYLDYQVWQVYARMWHPFIWIIMLIVFMIGGITGCIDVIKQNKPSNSNWKEYTYWKAPKKCIDS